MQRVADLDTPSMVVDLDKLEANIQRLQASLDSLGLANRPHIKTHKIPAIGHMQIAAGAKGITCQKLGEAEIFADAGFDDILIPYNLVGAPKMERLTRLARRVKMTVAVDGAVAARAIAEACDAAGVEVTLLIEVDTGMHRAGVQSPEDAQTLARSIADSPGVRFGGLMCYPTKPAMVAFHAEVRDRLTRDGIPLEQFSGGGTGAQQVSKDAGCTEHRSGTYSYNDLSVWRAGNCELDQCAMSVLVTVISTSCPGFSTIDGGSKTFTNDALQTTGVNGYVREFPEIYLEKMSEEHGVLNLSRLTDASARPRVGDKIHVIPNHACGTTNLHDVVYGYRAHGSRPANGTLSGDELIEVEWPVPARGKIR